MIGVIGLLLIFASVILLVVGLFKKNSGLKSKGFKCLGLGVILLIAGGLMTDSPSKPQQQATAPAPAATTQAQPKQEDKNDVPREYKMALKAAEQYLATMPFSKDGLYQQLTSDAGSKFPSEAARYAVDNVKVDWKQMALKSAQQYLSTMPFSKDGLYRQLTSDAGSKFPADLARYAVDNVKTDWNENALRSAKQYLSTMPMSNAELHRQLTSSAGDKYTKEQADYAISHLPK